MIPHLHETVQIGRNFPRKGPNPRECRREAKSAQFWNHKKNTSDRFFCHEARCVEFTSSAKVKHQNSGVGFKLSGCWRLWPLTTKDGKHENMCFFHSLGENPQLQPSATCQQNTGGWKSGATRPYPSPQNLENHHFRAPELWLTARNSFKLGSILPGPTSLEIAHLGRLVKFTHGYSIMAFGLPTYNLPTFRNKPALWIRAYENPLVFLNKAENDTLISWGVSLSKAGY